VIVAVFANRVRVVPDEYLSIGLLLRPVAEVLEAVSHGKENSAYKEAVKTTIVKYEKENNGRWILKMGKGI